MKIPKLAIIDDGLRPSCIPKNQSVEFITADRDTIRQGEVSDDDFSHGTITVLAITPVFDAIRRVWHNIRALNYTTAYILHCDTAIAFHI